MTDDEFKSEVQSLVEMLNNLRLIKDKGRRNWLIRELRVLFNLLIRS